jgi:hypothetical protein
VGVVAMPLEHRYLMLQVWVPMEATTVQSLKIEQ